jgi:hypothetical protein
METYINNVAKNEIVGVKIIVEYIILDKLTPIHHK